VHTLPTPQARTGPTRAGLRRGRRFRRDRAEAGYDVGIRSGPEQGLSVFHHVISTSGNRRYLFYGRHFVWYSS
jgi:hypothetical protein